MVKSNKIVVCGLKGIGKTTLLEQLIYGHVDLQDLHPTIEDIYVASVESDRGIREDLRIYDTEGFGDGSPEACQLPKQYHSIAEAFVLVYNTNSRQSFDAVDSLRRDIEKNKEKREITVIIIGISWRADEKREVDPSFAVSWSSREKLRHFDVCLAQKDTLALPFIYLASKLNLPPQKSTLRNLVIANKPKE